VHEGEKRENSRLRKYIDVIVEEPQSAMLMRGAIADISTGGMRIIVDQYLPVRGRYVVTMKRNPFLKVRCEVRWVKNFTNETYQVGMLIVDANEEDMKRLNSYLELESKRLMSS